MDPPCGWLPGPPPRSPFLPLLSRCQSCLLPLGGIQPLTGPADHSPCSTGVGHGALVALQHFVDSVFLPAALGGRHSRQPPMPPCWPALSVCCHHPSNGQKQARCPGDHPTAGFSQSQGWVARLPSKWVRVMLAAVTNKPPTVQWLRCDGDYFLPLLWAWCAIRSAGGHPSCCLWTPGC